MDWKEAVTCIKELEQKISGEFDMVVGVARGGAIPAALLARSMHVKNMIALKVRREDDERVLIGDVSTDITRKRILLVEDAVETGKSLDFLKQHLENKGAKVTTASFFALNTTQLLPDHFLSSYDTLPKFPWD